MREFTSAELELIKSQSVAPEAEDGSTLLNKIEKIDRMFPGQTVETIIGHIRGLESGHGQERNKPFAPEAPVVPLAPDTTPTDEAVTDPTLTPAAAE